MSTYISTSSLQKEMISIQIGSEERIALAIHLSTSSDSSKRPIYQVFLSKRIGNLQNIVLDELKRKYPAYMFTCDNII